jgi:hypothetical protein
VVRTVAEGAATELAERVESVLSAAVRGAFLFGKSRGGATMTIAVNSNAMKKRLSIDGRA